MPTAVGTQLNEVLVGSFTLAELGAANRPYLLINLEADPARSAYIYGVEFGANVITADAPVVSLIAQIARNLKPDPDQSIFDQIDDGPSGVSPSRLQRPYFHHAKAAPFDRVDSWTRPIVLASGINHCVVVGIGLDAALTGAMDVYLTVRGEWGAPGQKGPRLRQIGQ